MSPGARVIAIGVVGVLALLLLLRFVFPAAFFAVLSPLFGVGTAISTGTSGIFAGFGDGVHMRSEIVALEAQKRTLENEKATLAARITDLEALLGDEAEPATGIIAGVIARPPLAPYDVLVIGAGSTDGVQTETLVTAEGGVPVGTIASVSEHVSHVALFSAPERVTEAWIGSDRVPFSLVGKGAGAFFAEVPNDVAAVVGDMVYAAGPGPRPLGTVARIDTDPSSPEKTLRIQPLVNPFSISSVLIQR